MSLPSFEEACDDLRGLLASLSRPTRLMWAFREDLFAPRLGSFVVRHPLPPENLDLARGYFEQWAASGALELRAICQLDGAAVTVPWSPFELPAGVQGWESGFKATASEPWSVAHPARSPVSWWLHRQRPAYRRFQAIGLGIPVRPKRAA